MIATLFDRLERKLRNDSEGLRLLGEIKSHLSAVEDTLQRSINTLLEEPHPRARPYQVVRKPNVLFTRTHRDMFGNDLRATDSFGTPRLLKT